MVLVTFLIYLISKKIKKMYEFIQKFHSGWAYLTLLLLIVAIVNSVIGAISKREFLPKDRKIALFGLIGTHTQLLVGLILYFISPNGFKLFDGGFKEVMRNPVLRLIAVEHPIINIVAIVFVTYGWFRFKDSLTNKRMFNSISGCYAIGLVLILSRIPWSLWF